MIKREQRESRFQRLPKSTTRKWSPTIQRDWRKSAIKEFQARVAQYSLQYPLDQVENQPFRQELGRIIEDIFKKNIQTRLSLSFSEESAQFSMLMPEVYFFPILSRMHPIATRFRYCHVGSWLMPSFLLHATFYISNFDDIQLLVGKEAMNPRLWNGALHNNNNNNPDLGPLSGGYIEVLCNETFPIILHYNVYTRQLTIKYQYLVTVWYQHPVDGTVILAPKSAVNYEARVTYYKKKQEERNKKA